MTKIRSIIIDDEPNAAEFLQLMLGQHQGIEVLAIAPSADAGVDLIQSLKPDLVFLDVEMPGKNGFEVLKAFPKVAFKVIFVTAFNQYAINAIKHAALDYLLKPVDTAELEITIERVRQSLKTEDNRVEQLAENISGTSALEHVIISSKRGFISLSISDIVSIESMTGKYAFFYMVDGTEHLCTKPLGHYDEMLSESGFHRIHRSYLVNLKQIKTFDNEKDTVLMNNQRMLPVAARRRSKFRKRFLDCMAK